LICLARNKAGMINLTMQKFAGGQLQRANHRSITYHNNPKWRVKGSGPDGSVGAKVIPILYQSRLIFKEMKMT